MDNKIDKENKNYSDEHNMFSATALSEDSPEISVLPGDDLLPRVESGELSVEEAFAALEQIVQKMEEDGISLEDSFSCYETGIRLVRYCSERIDRVEKKVQMLRGEGEAPMAET